MFPPILREYLIGRKGNWVYVSETATERQKQLYLSDIDSYPSGKK